MLGVVSPEISISARALGCPLRLHARCGHRQIRDRKPVLAAGVLGARDRRRGGRAACVRVSPRSRSASPTWCPTARRPSESANAGNLRSSPVLNWDDAQNPIPDSGLCSGSSLISLRRLLERQADRWPNEDHRRFLRLHQRREWCPTRCVPGFQPRRRWGVSLADLLHRRTGRGQPFVSGVVSRRSLARACSIQNLRNSGADQCRTVESRLQLFERELAAKAHMAAACGPMAGSVRCAGLFCYGSDQRLGWPCSLIASRSQTETTDGRRISDPSTHSSATDQWKSQRNSNNEITKGGTASRFYPERQPAGRGGGVSAASAISGVHFPFLHQFRGQHSGGCTSRRTGWSASDTASLPFPEWCKYLSYSACKSR